MKPQHLASAVAFIALLVIAALLISGKRILIYEVKVTPGDHYFVPEHGDLGDLRQSSLVCRYFNGRKVLVKVFWYSSDNIIGKDECPFITYAEQ